MGSLNPFKTPKMPAPVVIESPVKNDSVIAGGSASPDVTAEVEAERKRLGLAIGSAGNIVSSLATARPDSGALTRRTLLGG